MRHIVLLPGLDGTGALFEGFRRAVPAGVDLEPVPLPSEALSYEELAARLAARMRLTPDTILLAESFSGPLAVLLAERQPVGTLVLCNSFVAPPGPRALARLPLAPVFHLPPPAILLRRYLVGLDAPDALVQQVRAVVGSVPPAVLAARLAGVLQVDVRQSLARYSGRLIYLRGTQDRLVPEASVRGVVEAASVPVAVARVPGPHLLLQAVPQAAWRAIEEAVLQPSAA